MIAPETRQDVKLDFSNDDTLDLTERSRLLETALAGVSPAQYERLGSEAGLPVRMLNAEARTMVEHALRPPLKVTLQHPAFKHQEPMSQGGKATTVTTPARTEVIADLTKPVDIGQVRIRARLWSAGAAGLPNSRTGEWTSVVAYEGSRNDPPQRPSLTPANASAASVHGGNPIEFLRIVPNKFKPSDLDGARLTQRFGKSGTLALKDVIGQAQAITGLKLLPGSEWAEWPVYVGSASCTCGEVLDGVRLALRAAWRRVDDVYVLAWDRRGLSALEAMAGMIAAVAREQARTDAAGLPLSTRLALGLALPFEPDDPYAWTPEQRTAFFGEPDPSDYGNNVRDVRPPKPITYAEMTDRQRSAVDAAFIANLSAETNAPPERTKVALTPAVGFQCGIFIPGVGWAYQPTPGLLQGGASADAYRRDYANKHEHARIAERIAESRRNPRPAPVAPSGPDQTLLVPARTRGIAVPALTVAKLNEILTAMRAKGFSLLVYPAFSGGYANLTTNAFPANPLLKDLADLQTASRMAKEQGISTIAAVDMLGWRPTGVKTHWLDTYKDILDVDVLGRPLTALAREQVQRGGRRSFEVMGDTVRPSSPEVRRRLDLLMADLVKVPGLEGVLLDNWRPEEAVEPTSGPRGSVALGYSVPDRKAVLLRDGLDPLDVHGNPNSVFVPTEPGSAPPRPSSQESYDTGRWNAGATVYTELANRLIASLKRDAPRLNRYVHCAEPLRYRYGNADSEPVGATTLRPGRNGTGSAEAWVPVESDAVLQDEIMNDRLVPFRNAILCDAEVLSFLAVRPEPDRIVVYDFRQAPKHAVEALSQAHIPPAATQ